MVVWWWLGTAAGIILLLGECLDRVVKQRATLEEWWTLLRDTPVPDLPRLMAKRTVAFALWVRGPSWLSWRSLGTSLFISGTLTTVAVKFPALIGDEYNDGLDILDITVVHCLIIYGINFVFDLATVCATIYVLHLIRSRNGAPVAIAMATDLGIAIACAGGCLFLAHFLYDLIFHYEVFAFWNSVSAASRDIWITISAGPLETWYRGKGTEITYAATTLLPTALYMLLLATMFAAKPVLRFARFVRHTDKPETTDPFKLLAAVIVVVGTIVTVVVLLIRWFAS